MEKWLPFLAIAGLIALCFHFAAQAREAVRLAYEMEYLIAEGCSLPDGATLTIKNRQREDVKFHCSRVQ